MASVATSQSEVMQGLGETVHTEIAGRVGCVVEVKAEKIECGQKK